MPPLPVSAAAELSVADAVAVSDALEEMLEALSAAPLLLSALLLASLVALALIAVEAGVMVSAVDAVRVVLVEFEPPARSGRSNSTPYAMQIALEPSAVTIVIRQYVLTE